MADDRELISKAERAYDGAVEAGHRYLDAHQLDPLMERMMGDLLRHKPTTPLLFMIDFLTHNCDEAIADYAAWKARTPAVTAESMTMARRPRTAAASDASNGDDDSKEMASSGAKGNVVFVDDENDDDAADPTVIAEAAAAKRAQIDARTAAVAAATTKQLRLLHFNDVYHIVGGNREPVGGAARFATAVDAHSDDNTLLFFSGDVFNPSLLSTITQGAHMVPVLNMLHIQCAVFGNHDFDFGIARLTKLASQCNFPWLLSNVIDTETNEPLAGGKLSHLMNVQIGEPQDDDSDDIRARKTICIGVIGLVEPDWLDTIDNLPATAHYFDFCDVGAALSKQLRAEGAEYVIALTHSRVVNDRLLAAGCPDIDLILGGHDHEYFREENNGITILNSGCDFKQLSKVVVTLPSVPLRGADGCVVKVAPNNVDISVERIDVTSKAFKPHPAVKEVVDGYWSTLSAKMEKVIGYTDVMLDCRAASVRTRETNAGNLIADVMRSVTHADITILNSGTLRGNSTYGPGQLVVRNILDILPGEDPIVSIKLSGEDVWAALENGISKWPSHEGRFPAISGAVVRFSGSLPPGQRLISVEIPAGVPLDRTREYAVCTKEYLAHGKDGFEMFLGKEYIVDEEHAQLLSTAVRAFFKSLKQHAPTNLLDDLTKEQLDERLQRRRDKAEQRECGVDCLSHVVLNRKVNSTCVAAPRRLSHSAALTSVLAVSKLKSLLAHARRNKSSHKIEKVVDRKLDDVGFSHHIAPAVEGRIINVDASADEAEEV